MSSAVARNLQCAEKLLKGKEFERALAILGEIDLESISPDMLAWRHLIYAETKLTLGEYDVESEIEYTISFYRQSNKNDKFGWAKYLHGWLLISYSKYFDARETLLESYTTYKRCDDHLSQACVLNRLSFVSYQLGDIVGATTYLKKCKSIYEMINDVARELIISFNLAQLYYAGGEIRRSLDLYEDTKCGLSVWSKNNIAIYNMQRAIPFALKGDFDLAQKTIREAVPYLEGFSREQAIYHEYLGWIYLLEGNYIEADKALRKGLKLSLDLAPESALVSQTQRRLADVLIGQGSYITAIQHADEALAVAVKINERVEIAACYRVFALVENHNGRSEKARHRFKQAIDLFSMIGARYELASTRYLAAVSGLYPEGQRQAFLYLSREYFESEQVNHYLLKIDKEIGQARPVNNKTPESSGLPPRIIGHNPAIKRLTALARNVAASEMSVLLTGPTGTGKDLFARYIHHFSGRKGRFVAVNTAAIPESMIEAELFGHRKGAFTGADRTKPGLIEEADQGTLYLNEIADSSPEFQAKLLDVLENRTVRRLGDTRERPVAFRLIAATNHNLEKHVRNNQFRADLFHRLNDIHIALPSLRDRLDDIPDLVSYFLAQTEIDLDGNDDALERLSRALIRHDWNGNIRQLKSEVERMALLSKGDLSHMITAAAQYRPSEREQLLNLLSQNDWNRREVARILGLSEGGIRYRIKKYKLSEKSPA
ncbi:MAG: tetratricopeptide repeat protein [FCB group bacterium]|nr:tetratricopeptide repeat protein [FCB group bacterium]